MFFIISAFRKDLTTDQNLRRNSDLGAMLDFAIPVQGAYQGEPELGYMVWGMSERAAVDLAREFQQECILSIDPNTSMASLVYTDSRENSAPCIGKFKFDPQEMENYTEIGGRKFSAKQ